MNSLLNIWANLKEAFADEKRFWPLAAAILGVISFLKGFRRPSSWAASQAMINYDHGIIKRGLFGETFGKVFQLSHYLNFTVFSFLFLYILFRLLVKFTQTSGVLSRVGNGEIAALFFSSVVISYFGVLVGYLDIPLAVLTLSLLLIRKPTHRFIAAAPLCTVATLMHEMFLVGFLPVILFSFILDAKGEKSAEMRKVMLVQTLALAFFCLVATSFLATKGLVSVPTSKALENEATARADFWVDPNVFSMLTRNAKDNFLDMARCYTAIPEWRIQFLGALIIFLPLGWVLTNLNLRMLRPPNDTPSSKLFAGVTLGAMFAPLVLNALGSDCARWNVLVCLDGFLILMLLARAYPDRRIVIGPGTRNLFIILVAIHLASGEFMMGMAPSAPGANPYPFSAKTSQFLYQLGTRSWHPPRMKVDAGASTATKASTRKIP